MKYMKYLLIASNLLVAISVFSQEITEAQIMAKTRELANIDDENMLNKQLLSLENSKSQQDLVYAYKYYLSNNDESAAEKLKTKGLKKFPKGIFSNYVELSRIAKLTDIHKRDSAYQQLLSINPNLDLGMEALTMSLGFAAEGDTVHMNQYQDAYLKFAKGPNGRGISKISMYPMFINALMKKDTRLALPYLDEGMQLYHEKLALENTPDNQARYYQLISLYVDILLKEKKNEEAYQYLKALSQEFSISKRNFPSYLQNKLLNTYLVTGRYSDVFESLEKTFVDGDKLPNLEMHLKKAYAEKYKSLNNYDKYLDSLKTEQHKLFIAQILNSAINKPGPNFELQDLDGNVVKLTDLRGKVLVLDFWATWCGPCKASFPMMQKAVNKYKDDSNVKFLFIHTWDKVKDPVKDAKDYITTNNYTFDVLMDLRNRETNQSAVANAYGVRGIPAKVIIDKKGNIRFETSGFSGDESKAMEELSQMIEFAKTKS